MTNPTIARPGEYASPDDLAKQALDEVEPAKEPAKTEETPKKELSPIERWREGLKAAKLTEEQAGLILDDMLTKGFWEREYRLFHGRIILRLRTRDAQNINRIMSAIDRIRTLTEANVEETIAMLNLAGSIVQLRDVVLPHPDHQTGTVDEIEAAFDKRREFVSRIPGPLMPSVRAALVHFDKTVAAALANGAADGF